MRSDNDRWWAYFYDPPHDLTLRNLRDELDHQRLARLEDEFTFDRASEILSGEVEIVRSFDAEHVKAIHYHLFQDLYEWAGQYRTVDMGKTGGVAFAAVEGGIDAYVQATAMLIQRANWQTMLPAEFAAAVANIYTTLNYAHPFREGNGRTGRVFMRQVAELSDYRLAFGRLDPDAWNRASAETMNPDGSLDPRPLFKVFESITTTPIAVQNYYQKQILTLDPGRRPHDGQNLLGRGRNQYRGVGGLEL